MGIKVEIGPGEHPLGDDWVCVDTVKRPCVDRVAHWGVDRLPFEDGVADLVYASHVLEHVPWTNTVGALKEVHRILRPGGVLEVWVPDGEKIIRTWLDGAPERDGWWRYNPDHDPDVWLNGRIFTHGPGEENFHRALFTPRLLRKQLLAAGFVTLQGLAKPRGYDHGFINMGMGATK